MLRAVILTAHPDDYRTVRAYLSELTEDVHPQGTVYEFGQFSADGAIWEVAIAEIDNNNASAGSETERAANHFHPDVILLVSVAAGIKDGSSGDVIVADKIYGYESGKAMKSFHPRPEVWKPSYQLKARAKAEGKKSDWLKGLSHKASAPPSVFIAPIASGDKEVADQQTDLLQFLHSQYGDAVAIETVGFGFLAAIDANENILGLTVHGISHSLNSDTETIQQDARAIAIQHASAFAFEILAKYKPHNVGANNRIQGVVSYRASSHLLIGVGQSGEVAIGENLISLTDERHRRIDHAKNLIREGQFSQAVRYLKTLKEELWHQLDNVLKYRLLANLGMAELGLDEVNDAAARFLEGLQYNPNDDGAIAYAAMGYIFQKDYTKADQLIEEALRRNPANVHAHSLRIRIAPDTESIESVLEQIPPAYHESLDVLIALGEAALNRGLYNKAEEWWQAALGIRNDNSMNSVKSFLGVVLLETVAKHYPFIAAGQLPEPQKISLERAVALFTDVLGGDYINPNNLSHLEFTALANRSSALRLLSRIDEATRDVEMVLVKKPGDPYLIKQRALLAHEKGDEAAAYNYASQILSSSKTPEAFLLAASSLMALQRDQEAEEMLDRFLETDSSEDLKREAKRLKFDLFLNRDDRQNAEEMLQQVSSEDLGSILTLVQQIRWQKHIHAEEKIPVLVEQAKASLISKSSAPAQIILADTLYSLGYYRDATEIYEKFVDQSLNSALSHRLLNAYYLSGSYKDALDLCERLLNQYGALEVVSEMAAYIYDLVGDVTNVQRVCQVYLQTFPNDVMMQLRLAAAHYAKGDYEKLDKFLDSKPALEKLDLVPLKKLAQLYKVTNRVDDFLEVIYEIRHRFYDDGQVHIFYKISYTEALKMQPGIQSFKTVQDECGVLLRNEFGKEQWYIFENRPDSIFAQHELNCGFPLYQALIEKSVGDEIVQAEDSFGRTVLRIEAITDKYFAADKQSDRILENHPNLKNFRMIAVPMDGEELLSDWVQQFIEGLQRHQDRFDLIKAEYISGKIPFGAVAALVHRNPVELWQILAFGDVPFIHAWTDFEYERFEDALIHLQKGGLVVVDPISLITLHYLEVADDVVGILGEFGIAQSTIDLLQAVVETAKGFQREGFTTFGVREGQGIFHEVSPERIAQQKEFFERIISWTRNNCRVLPCYRALDINKDMRDKLRDYVGPAFIDTAMIASEAGRILFSDDQWLRWYARAESGVPGVWMQVVLQYCLVQQASNESLYRKATLGLVASGYSYTIVDANVLTEAARLSRLKQDSIYTQALQALANERINTSYAVTTLADFLRQLYLEVILTEDQFVDPRDALVFEALKVLTVKRSIRAFVRELKEAIHHRFELIPLQERDVLSAIDAWFSSQSFIT